MNQCLGPNIQFIYSYVKSIYLSIYIYMELQLGDVWNTWTWWNESWKTIPQSKTCFMNLEPEWTRWVKMDHTLVLFFSCRLAFWQEHFFVIPRYKMISNYDQFTCKFIFKSTDLFLEPPQPRVYRRNPRLHWWSTGSKIGTEFSSRFFDRRIFSTMC